MTNNEKTVTWLILKHGTSLEDLRMGCIFNTKLLSNEECEMVLTESSRQMRVLQNFLKEQND